MKKLLMLVVLFAGVNCFAGIDYGLEAGQTRLGFYGGMSVPQDWDVFGSGVKKAPGDTGYAVGVEVLRNITPAFALGFEVNYAKYGVDTWGPGAFGVESRTFGANVLGRINFFAEQPTRIYIPFGAGLSRVEATDTMGGESKETNPTVLAGLGIELDMGPVWTIGLEGRYTHSFLDDDKYPDDKFATFGLLLKVGARF